LVFIGRRSKAGIPSIDGWAPIERGVGKGRAAVVLERTDSWIRIDLVFRPGQETAPVVVAEIVTERIHSAGNIGNVGAYAGFKDGMADCKIPSDVDPAAAARTK
jgi:hypothetical protein